MKGFIYLLEISVAMMLLLIVLGTVSNVNVKENWERADLIGAGDNLIKIIRNSDILDVINGDLSKIEKIIPSHINFSLKLYGVPKSNITVGCTQSSQCNYIANLLSGSYINDRWINFSVVQFDIDSLNYIPSYLDAVVFVNYTNYGIRKSAITDYLKKGGVVVGINATKSNNDANFNEIFGLSPTSSGSSSFYFTEYGPLKDETQKYFYAAGFNVSTPNTISSKKWGYWYVWDVARKVNISSSSTVDIENKTKDEGIIRDIKEGYVFSIKGPDDKFYAFMVKKVFWDALVFIQPLNASLIFKDFSETSGVTGKLNILESSNNEAEMTSNNSAVWISDFPNSEEYKTLVKAAIMSRVKELYIKTPDFNKEHVAISSFYPLCCEVPEVLELTIYLWYKI